MAYQYDTLRNHETNREQPGLEHNGDRHSDKYLATMITTTSPLSPLPPTATSLSQPSPKKVLGLPSFAAGLCIGLLIAVIVGAAVGGGLGSTLAQCQHELITFSALSTSNNTTPMSNTTTTASLNDYAVANYTSVNLLHNDCPSLANTRPQTVWGDSFIPDCNRDYANGRSAAGGGVVSDIIGVISYSFMDCMNACSAFNAKSKLWGVNSTCKAISFDLDLANTTRVNGANCWLKNATLSVGIQPFLSNLVMSAKLAT
jgi:hypothetical protein